MRKLYSKTTEHIHAATLDYSRIKRDKFYSILTPRLKKKVTEAVFSTQIERFAEFFSGNPSWRYDQASIRFQFRLIHYLRAEEFPPSTPIIKQAHFVNNVYFIVMGTAKLSFIDQENQLLYDFTTLFEGSFYGEY